MLNMRAVVALTLLLPVMAVSTFAQTRLDAQELLKRVAETYKNLKSCHFEVRMVIEQKTESMQMRTERKSEEVFVLAAVNPDRIHIESRNPTFSFTTISDGQSDWFYAPLLNQYTQKTGVVSLSKYVLAQHWTLSDPIMIFSSAPQLLKKYEGVENLVKEARIIREEAIAVGEQRIKCYVVEVSYTVAGRLGATSSRELWIDQARDIILREVEHQVSKSGWGSVDESTRTITFTVAKVNEPMSEALFTFTPPEGTKEVGKMSLPIKGPQLNSGYWEGKAAAAFALKDLAGKLVDGQGLKGKVVVLAFLATWCGPCLKELPQIEKLDREFKEKGVVVLGISDEESELTRAFMKQQAYTFTLLKDEGKELAKKYEINGIPQSFVIGRDGRIQMHHVGYVAGDEKELRSAVEKALSSNGSTKAPKL